MMINVFFNSEQKASGKLPAIFSGIILNCIMCNFSFSDVKKKIKRKNKTSRKAYRGRVWENSLKKCTRIIVIPSFTISTDSF